MDWGWTMPEPVSTFGGEIDSLYYLILWITGAIFVIVEVALIAFVLRYRHREGRRATYSHGSKKAEVVWTVVPFILVLFIAYASNDVWLRVKVADRGLVDKDVLPLRVTGKQFEWLVTYPGADGELGNGDDFEVRNQLHIPVGRPVRVELMSEDVIHSFFLPDFRVKQDAVPGMMIPVWFEATRTGQYPLACAELCGLGHYRMEAAVTVHEAADFERWMAEEAPTAKEPGGVAGEAPAAAPEGGAPAAEEEQTSEPEDSA